VNSSASSHRRARPATRFSPRICRSESGFTRQPATIPPIQYLGIDLSISRPYASTRHNERQTLIAPHTAGTPASVAIDGVFRALSDPTRRDVVERLSAKPASVSELAASYRMAMPSFLEHLKVLEGCGLVQSRKTGRVRTYRLTPDRLKVAEDWLGRQRKLWERRLNQLDDYLLALKKERSK
jgi:DNA-binding transcriptional ArsR family regulator